MKVGHPLGWRSIKQEAKLLSKQSFQTVLCQRGQRQGHLPRLPCWSQLLLVLSLCKSKQGTSLMCSCVMYLAGYLGWFCLLKQQWGTRLTSEGKTVQDSATFVTHVQGWVTDMQLRNPVLTQWLSYSLLAHSLLLRLEQWRQLSFPAKEHPYWDLYEKQRLSALPNRWKPQAFGGT